MKSRSCVAALLWVALATPMAFADTGGATLPAISVASQDVSLSFSRTGRVADVLVKKGDRVKAGDRVAQMDDREEQAQLAIDEAKAKDTTAIEAEEKLRDQKKVDLKRLQSLPAGATSPFEIDHAKLDVEIEDAKVKMSKFEHEQDQRKAALTAAIVEKLKLLSPINGIVEQIWVKAGETQPPDQQIKVMRIVNVDPLWVEVPVPLSVARGLQKDKTSTARVVFPDKVEASGKIINIGAVADPASDTINVRLEVANPELRPAGERVRVDFGPAKVAVKDKQ